MPRRRVAAKREVLPDPKFGSEVIASFINVLMKSGKKSIAENIVYGALDHAHSQLNTKDMLQSRQKDEDGEEGSSGSAGSFSVLDLFDDVISNVSPSVEVRSRRVGGATYQVPVEVPAKRSRALAMRWLVQSARGRNEKGMMLRLAGEFVDAFQNRGATVKKREDTHRMARANQAFAHFRWN